MSVNGGNCLELPPIRFEALLIETVLLLVYTISRRETLRRPQRALHGFRSPAKSQFARTAAHMKGLEMAENLKVSVRRQIDRLKKDLAAATAQFAALQEEIKRHELIYEMLDGRKTDKRTQRSRSTGGALKKGRRGAMIDWKAVFATLPDQFTLDTMSADKTAGEKPRTYLRQVIVRWSKEGRIRRTGRGMYLKI